MRYPIILLDNGHGKETAGKRSPDGVLQEWKWTREMTIRLRDDLKDRGYNVFLVTPEDIDVPLAMRVKRVNAYCDHYGKGNIILVSIHINASGNTPDWRPAHGWSAYTSKGVTDSDVLASCLYDAAATEFPDRRIRKFNNDSEPDFEENFYLLKHTRCVAVLTENFFMDNEYDAEFLQSDQGRSAILHTHVKGILKYLKAKYR
ncbi:MAG: N-acetylmuramoyl-L-alanine amidase [Bacteroidales bacterium]|nr:N-acetylmuramoyl-L-alanine amidase [Bacteroidales bacterium]